MWWFINLAPRTMQLCTCSFVETSPIPSLSVGSGVWLCVTILFWPPMVEDIHVACLYHLDHLLWFSLLSSSLLFGLHVNGVDCVLSILLCSLHCFPLPSAKPLGLQAMLTILVQMCKQCTTMFFAVTKLFYNWRRPSWSKSYSHIVQQLHCSALCFAQE